MGLEIEKNSKFVTIVRYGEINIKGKNRSFFEKALVKNIKRCLTYKGVPYTAVERERNRIYVYTDADCSCLKVVFGVSSVSKARVLPYNDEVMGKIREELKQVIPTMDFSTFRVSVKRLAKQLPMTSLDVEKEMGAFIVETFDKKVSLREYEQEVSIEFTKDAAYIFMNSVKGFDGLPPGTEGEVAILFEDEKSILTTILMMKRGCLCHLYSTGFKDVTLLEKYMFRTPMLTIQKEKDLKSFMDENRCVALVVGDQFPELKEHDWEVLRPIVAYTDGMVTEQLKIFEGYAL